MGKTAHRAGGFVLVVLYFGGTAESQTQPNHFIVEGYIRSEAAGTPIEGGVDLLEVGSDGVVRMARSDRDGRYTLAVPEGLRKVTVRAGASGYAPSIQEIVPRAPGESVRLDFTLVLAVSVSGFLVDAAGEPVADAVIRVLYPGEKFSGGVAASTDVVTNSVGRFRLPVVRRHGPFVLEVAKPGHVVSFSRELNASGAAMEDIVIPVQLDLGMTLTGTVVDSSLVPIPGAGVAVNFSRPSPAPQEVIVGSRRPEAHGSGHLKAPVTSDDGRFTITGIPWDATNLRLIAAHRGRIFKPTRLSFATTVELKGRGKLTIVLQRR